MENFTFLAGAPSSLLLYYCLIEKGVRTTMRIFLFKLQRPHNTQHQRCNWFLFDLKLLQFCHLMSIFGDFWNKKLTASFWPRLWPLSPKRKKLQLEPILTNYGLISSSGHLEDAYMSF
jgi:hypothetical protein